VAALVVTPELLGQALLAVVMEQLGLSQALMLEHQQRQTQVLEAAAVRTKETAATAVQA
jgi:hypothetical protein